MEIFPQFGLNAVTKDSVNFHDPAGKIHMGEIGSWKDIPQA
jgi:hypothetical protein